MLTDEQLLHLISHEMAETPVILDSLHVHL